MKRIARFSFHRLRLMVAGWLLAAVIGVLLSSAVGSKFDTDTTLLGTDSQAAYNLLNANFPAASGEGDQMVIHTVNGATVRSTSVRSAVTAALTQMADVAGVSAIRSGVRTGYCWAIVHIGACRVGRYEYPGPDTVLKAAGSPLTRRFLVTVI